MIGTHKPARIFYTVLRYGVAYQMEKSLHRLAKELGYELTKIETQTEAEPQPA